MAEAFVRSGIGCAARTDVAGRIGVADARRFFGSQPPSVVRCCIRFDGLVMSIGSHGRASLGSLALATIDLCSIKLALAL
jgi:hypothetical protein